MNLRFAAVVIVVLFIGAPTLESIGARAQQSPCQRACSAAERTDPETLRRIIGEGANICYCVCPNANGGGILHASVISRCSLCIDLLTSPPSYCYCQDRDNNENTPLILAAGLCYGPETDRILEAGCSIYSTNNADHTALCEVARTTNSGECGQVARTLVAAGSLTCRDCGDGQTPCGGCVQQGVCDVLDQDGACNC